MVGVAAAESARPGILLAGVAGLVAGAMSMAAGEYVSVSSQADTEKADLAKERAEHERSPTHELRELQRIYVDRGLDPGPSADTPYETKAELLPKTLREAVFALKDDPFFREALGAEFVDYYVHIKNAEIERFQAEVSDWEQREYFEMF